MDLLNKLADNPKVLVNKLKDLQHITYRKLMILPDNLRDLQNNSIFPQHLLLYSVKEYLNKTLLYHLVVKIHL